MTSALPEALSKLPPKQALLRLVQELKRRQDRNKLSRYKPYPKQIDFHNRGATYRERLFRAGNQCVSPWTFIETESAKALSATAFFSTGARVLAWAGESECVAQLQGGFVRGIEPAFRLVTEQGHFFDCSANHQILTEHGWLSLDQIVSQSSGQRFWGTREDWQASCVECGYLCDPQLPAPSDSALASLQLPVDALQRSLSLSQEDAEERIRTHTNIFQGSAHHSNAGDAHNQHAGLFASFAGPAMHTDVLPLSGAHQALRQLAIESCASPQSYAEPSLHEVAAPCLTSSQAQHHVAVGMPAPRTLSLPAFVQSVDAQDLGCSTASLDRDGQQFAMFFPLSSPKLVGGVEIISIIPIGYQPIVDCQIPDIHNYKAAGVYHHNCGKTYSSAYEIAFHLTGKYPEWWKGKRWNRGVTGWAVGQSMQSTRDTIQRLVLGRPGEWGTGTIPAELIIGQPKRATGVSDAVDCVFVRHISGGVSRLYFKSCEQGREKLQGETLDFAALDEEPPADIYTEVLTRTNATKGIVWITFTPLLGMSEVVRLFLQKPTRDRSDTNMTIEDVGHYSKEDVAMIVASYPEHEREARAKGIPILGSGRVWPIAESAITVDPFQIPDHWPIICGVDFGIDHPSAGVWLAWDRDNDITYLYDCYRVSNETPAQLVPRILQRGPWVPVSWPADGLQRSKGDGIQLADQYRTHGANMLHEYAQLPETGDEEGKKTSRVSVEAGVMAMFDDMKKGKFKVFAGLEDFFSEFRLYHRKDGQIVKLQDDVLSAARYAWVMRRYAECPPDPQKMNVMAVQSSYDWRVG